MPTNLESEPPSVHAGGEAGETLLLHAERAEILRQTRVTGTVEVVAQTTERAEPVSIELAADTVDVKRVAIGRMVDIAPATREEGDTTIIPVIEEILVVEKRLMLKEEIHIKRVRTTRTETRTVILREQHAVISRSDPDHGAHPADDVVNPRIQKDG